MVLEYAEVATGCPAEVSEELAARVRAHLSDAEFVELAAWVALENFRSRFNAGLGLRSQGFSDPCDIPMGGPHHGAIRCLTPRPTRRRVRGVAPAPLRHRVSHAGQRRRRRGRRPGRVHPLDRRGDAPVRSVRAYLVTIVTRLCLDQLDSARVERVTYTGPGFPSRWWSTRRRPPSRRTRCRLPSSSCSRSSRRSSVPPISLHDVFGYSFDEVARVAGRDSPAACRQLAARARQAHRGASPALRCRPAPRARADRPLPRRLRHRGPLGPPVDAVRRRRRLDRRRGQGPGGHAPGGRPVPQLEAS